MVRKKKIRAAVSRLDLGRYEPPEFSDETPVEEIVHDALVLAIATVRLAVKNLVIVRALRDQAAYDDRWLISAIGTEFAVLAEEKSREADRVDTMIEAARDKAGARPAHPEDYGPADIEVLARRTLTLRALAQELIALQHDETTIAQVLVEARDRALTEIADHIHFNISLTSNGDRSLTAEQRAMALGALAADLRDAVRDA